EGRLSPPLQELAQPQQRYSQIWEDWCFAPCPQMALRPRTSVTPIYQPEDQELILLDPTQITGMPTTATTTWREPPDAADETATVEELTLPHKQQRAWRSRQVP
ncbi:unnamed protein product, partial [Polarella glacialis]